MHYWDSSALVPLCIQEESSDRLRAIAKTRSIVTWCLSSVEMVSAIERRARDGSLDAGARRTALGFVEELRGSWTEVTATGAVREHAHRLLSLHPLRAADALQLAAALTATASRPTGHVFVSADARLCAAAEREGFTALG